MSEEFKNALARRVYDSIRPRSLCRDCADHGPRCPNSGELCDSLDRAKEIATNVELRCNHEAELEQKIQGLVEATQKVLTMIEHQNNLEALPRVAIRHILEDALTAYKEGK